MLGSADCDDGDEDMDAVHLPWSAPPLVIERPIRIGQRVNEMPMAVGDGQMQCNAMQRERIMARNINITYW